MEGLSTLWTSLTPQRKVAVILATILAFTAILLLGRFGESRSMTLLYGGLESNVAGEVLQALEAQGVPYDVRGGSIYVDAAQRDSLRMSLASQGLPANGGQGYELLDTLSGFSTTSQMFDAAYWRAKEGELARTIVTSSAVNSARVHISAPSTRGFQRDQKPTAAVTVTTGDGSLSTAQARAFRYLVASSVPGLAVQDVAIIDGQGNLVAFADEQSSTPGQDLSSLMRERVQRLLEARVGAGNAVVEVSVETISQSEQILERRIDPESRIAISTDVTESTNTAQNSGGGDVTVASNLPEGDAAGGDNSSSQGSETRQVTNFEISETTREIVRGPGEIRRITVAALINDVVSTSAEGETTRTPRAAEELDALRALISSAVGFDDARGDQITIQSLAFEPVAQLGTEISAADAGGLPLDMMSLIRLGVMSVVALILGLFVVRPILMSGGTQADTEGPLALPGGGEDSDTFDLANVDSEPAMDLPMMGDLPTFSFGDDSDADPVERLREMIDERQDETLQILQSWMEDNPEATEKA